MPPRVDASALTHFRGDLMRSIAISNFSVRTSRGLLFYVAIFVAFFAPMGKAQVVGGTINGTVTDATGALVQGASVLVRNNDTGNQRTLITDSIGRFSAPSIPVGTYTITASGKGFAAYRRAGI